MQFSLLLTFTTLLASAGITLAAPTLILPVQEAATLEKRAYSVCCQTIVGGDLTLGTGTAFNCTTGSCSGSGTALTCGIRTGSGAYLEYNLCAKA